MHSLTSSFGAPRSANSRCSLQAYANEDTQPINMQTPQCEHVSGMLWNRMNLCMTDKWMEIYTHKHTHAHVLSENMNTKLHGRTHKHTHIHIFETIIYPSAWVSLAHFNFLVSAGLGRNSVARVFKPCMRFKISCCIGNHSVYNKLPDAW